MEIPIFIYYVSYVIRMVIKDQSDKLKIDILGIMKALYDNNFDGYLRPDHGRMIWGEEGKPGYGLYDRALGASYINGVWETLNRFNKQSK